MEKEEKKELKEKCLDRQGVAELLGISVPTVDRYVKEGLLPSLKIKGKVIFLKAKVLKFLFADNLPKMVGERLDLVLRTKLKQASEYGASAKRLLRLKRILFLMDLQAKEKDMDERRQVIIRDELNLLLDEEQRFEKEEREKVKEVIKNIKEGI